MSLGTEASQERKGDSEKFVMATPTTSPTDQVKVVVTLSGDVISHADINLKLPRPGGKQLHNYELKSILLIKSHERKCS